MSLPVACFGRVGIGGASGGQDVAEELEAPGVMATLLVHEGELERPLRDGSGALDLPRGQEAFGELGGPEGKIGADAQRFGAAHPLLEQREPLVHFAEPDAGEPEQRRRDGPPHVEALLAADVHALLEERQGLLEPTAPQVDEAGQSLRDGLRERMSGGLGGAGSLVEVVDRGIEVAQVGAGEAQPRRRRDERDAVLEGRAFGRHRPERLDVLTQHLLGFPEPSLGVVAVAQIPASQGLERWVPSGLADPQAALAVLHGEIGLASEVVVVDEVSVDARETLLIPERLRQRFGFLRERQHAVELPHLQQGRPQLEPQIDGLLGSLRAVREMGQGHHRLLEEADGFAIDSPRGGLGAGLPQVGDGLVPHLAT